MSLRKNYLIIPVVLVLFIAMMSSSLHIGEVKAENITDPNLTAILPEGSFYSSPSDPNDPASKAFDGSNETWWTGIAKDESKGYWIACDLGEFYNISRWSVENFKEIPGLSVRGYELQISVDNKSYQKVDSIYEVLDAEATDRILSKHALARFVKLYIPADLTGTDGIARIAEFHVFGSVVAAADNPYTNDYSAQQNGEDSANIVAGRMTGISYSAGDPNDPPKKSFDGDAATWSTFWGNGIDPNPWLQVDLGGSYMLTKWIVKNSDIFDGYFICSNYNLLVSVDGTNWSRVDTIDNSAFDVTTEQQLANPVEAKYVRLEVTRGANGKISNGDDLARIAEFELYAQNTNILAQSRVGISYSSGDPNDPPQKSFDGDNATWSTFWPDSNEGTEARPWLRADLNRTYLIKKWKVVNSNVFDGTFICSNYSLQISEDGVSWDTIDFIDNSEFNISTEKTLANPVQAHFIRIVVNPGENNMINRGDNLARIAEFEVFGT